MFESKPYFFKILKLPDKHSNWRDEPQYAWMKVQYWRICLICEKAKLNEAITKWASHKEGRLIIIIECEACRTNKTPK